MPDQETQDFYNEEPVVEEQVEQQEEVVQAAPEPVAPANQALIAELQQTRENARQAREELHALRIAGLQQAAIPQDYDPIETAMKRIEKTMDPDAFKFVAPGLRLMVQESHLQRQREEALMQRNQYLEQTVTEIAQEARSRKIYTQLSQQIPDLDAIGPRLTELLGKESPEVQKMYIDNPSLLVPMANALRASGSVKPVKNVQGKRNELAMDLGAGERANPTTASDIQAMRPGSKEFVAQQNAFWGSSD